MSEAIDAMLANAYQLGRMDARDLLSSGAGPYQAGTREAEQYRAGWRAERDRIEAYAEAAMRKDRDRFHTCPGFDDHAAMAALRGRSL